MSLINLIARAVRAAPAGFADSFVSRVLIPRQANRFFAPVFEEAALSMAPGMKMSLSASDFMHGWIAFTGIYERELSQKLRDIARSGDVLVDVGANWGYFSILWAAAKSSNRVVAIEASPRNYEPLKRNIEINGLGDRVAIHFVAAGAQTGAMPFDLGPADIYGWGGFSAEATQTTVEVPVQRLDDICAGLPRIDALKIDVEGAEAIVLGGAKTLLAEKRVRHIFLELNDERMKILGIDRSEPQRMLESFGYTCSENGDALEARLEV